MKIKNNKRNRKLLEKIFSKKLGKEFEPFPIGMKYKDLQKLQ